MYVGHKNLLPVDELCTLYTNKLCAKLQCNLTQCEMDRHRLMHATMVAFKFAKVTLDLHSTDLQPMVLR